MEFPAIIDAVNAVLWVSGNVTLGYSAVVLMIFLVSYVIIFDPRATTGGKLIYQFMLSLAGVMALNIIGVYIDPSADTKWFMYPDDVEPWRPILRLIVYVFIAWAISSLVVLLILRKWFPHKLKKASDIKALVKDRQPTKEIPIFVPPTKGPDGSAGGSGASDD